MPPGHASGFLMSRAGLDKSKAGRKEARVYRFTSLRNISPHRRSLILLPPMLSAFRLMVEKGIYSPYLPPYR